MNYIYDIYLNFNKAYFDFYEWKNNDPLIHVKKIPILKTTTDNFKSLISHQVMINNESFDYIKGKTEIYNKTIRLNCLIVTDAKNVMALKFDDKGLCFASSSLLLEDEFDILEFCLKMKEHPFNFTILNKLTYVLATRKENEEKKYLLSNLHKASEDTLKYLYYDCFNKEETNTQIIIKELLEAINNGSMISQIYNILKPVSTN